MKGKINEIGDTENGLYALGQVTGRAYDRMLKNPKNVDGVVALDPKYGRVAQDAAYAAAGGYNQWAKKFKEKYGRKPTDDERHKFMQNYHNGCMDYGEPESKRNGVVKLSESQLQTKVLNESVKNFDHANIVPQELAEKLGFKPEYKSYEDGLELWGKYLDFDPYDEYSGKTKKLLDELGIKEFTSWSRSVRGNSGHVRITVKPKPKSDAQYFYPKPIVPELYENTRKKNTVRLNESQLKKIIAESVKKVISEMYTDIDFSKSGTQEDVLRTRLYHALSTAQVAYNKLVDCFFENPKNCYSICQETIYNLKSELPNNPTYEWVELMRELVSFARCCGDEQSKKLAKETLQKIKLKIDELQKNLDTDFRR